MKYYLYRHIRLDKNEPFYIGIGSKSGEDYKDFKSEYNRAFSKQRRDSKIWKLITKKTSYSVEILLESDDYSFIKEKEKEFIKLYGRIDKNTGCLSNMTDGGDGTIGWVPSEENINNMKKAHIGRNYNSIFGIKIYQYSLEGKFIREWNSIQEAAFSINRSKSSLSKVTKNNLNGNYCNGFYWSLYKNDNIEVRPFNSRKKGGSLCHV